MNNNIHRAEYRFGTLVLMFEFDDGKWVPLVIEFDSKKTLKHHLDTQFMSVAHILMDVFEKKTGGCHISGQMFVKRRAKITDPVDLKLVEGMTDTTERYKKALTEIVDNESNTMLILE